MKIIFGGIPKSRNVLFLEIFLKRAAKPSAGNPVLTWPAPKIPKTFSGTCSATFSGPRWTWPGFAPRLPGTFSGTFSGTLLNLTGCTEASQTFTGTFSRTLLNLYNLALRQCLPDLHRNLLRNPVEPDLALHQSIPDLHRNLLQNPVEPNLALPRPSPEPSPEPCWNWMALHQGLPHLLRNLRNLLQNLVEPDPAPAPVHTGAILTLLGKKNQTLDCRILSPHPLTWPSSGCHTDQNVPSHVKLHS